MKQMINPAFALIAISIMALACSKKAQFVDRHDRFPLEKVPEGIKQRADSFAIKYGYRLDFLVSSGSTPDLYTLRCLVSRESQKMPSQETLDQMQNGEIAKIRDSIIKEVFFGQALRAYKCILLGITVIYFDNMALFMYSD